MTVVALRGAGGLPEYGGLGGTGGQSSLPTESEKDGAPSLTLSRLQLLGVGLTSIRRGGRWRGGVNMTSHSMGHETRHRENKWRTNGEQKKNAHLRRRLTMKSVTVRKFGKRKLKKFD